MIKWHEFEKKMPDDAKLDVLEQTGIFPINFWMIDLYNSVTVMIDESGEDRYTVMLRDQVAQEWIFRIVGSEQKIREWLYGVIDLSGGVVENNGEWQ